MKLEYLGYNDDLELARIAHGFGEFAVGRVLAEHKEQYIVGTEQGEVKAEITGNLRFAARGRQDFPAVGDWVALTAHDHEFAVIHGIIPRFSMISRRAVGQFGEIQIIAANIDYAFLLQAVGRDFNVNRLERYLTICHASGVAPLIVLTKTDLIGEQEKDEIIASIKRRIEDVPVIAISNETKAGYEELLGTIRKGRTYCMLGSSGVGKSTLLNNLAGRAVMRTDAIGQGSNRGRHVTSHRELTILDNGAMLVDNPGMREVGIADAPLGLATTFDKIMDLAGRCRFKDCTHTSEAGCAVLAAVALGELDEGSYAGYLKMERERAHFEASVVERRKKEKAFGRLMKNYKKDMRDQR